jgi:hypothetical protein
LIDVARFEALSKSIGRRNRYGAYVASLLDRAKRARSLLC